MTHPIRYAVLDHAADQAALWHLTDSVRTWRTDGVVEVRPPRTVDDIRPHLEDLLREGHVELFLFQEPESPALRLQEALAAVADDSNWDSETADTWYGVITTDSGVQRLRVEAQAYRQGT